MGCTKVGEKKYEPATLVRAFEYFALSRTSYRQLCDDIELPSISTLTRLTSAIKNIDDNDYLYSMFFCLRELRKKNCILLLDEVYVKSTLQYHGGTVFGKAVNKLELLANTVLSFLNVCFFGGPKLLYKMLPAKELDAAFLYQQTKLILESIKRAGGTVKAIICDGNRVNQHFLKSLTQILYLLGKLRMMYSSCMILYI